MPSYSRRAPQAGSAQHGKRPLTPGCQWPPGGRGLACAVPGSGPPRAWGGQPGDPAPGHGQPGDPAPGHGQPGDPAPGHGPRPGPACQRPPAERGTTAQAASRFCGLLPVGNACNNIRPRCGIIHPLAGQRASHAQKTSAREPCYAHAMQAGLSGLKAPAWAVPSRAL